MITTCSSCCRPETVGITIKRSHSKVAKEEKTAAEKKKKKIDIPDM